MPTLNPTTKPKTKTEFDYGQALKRLKEGKLVCRRGWNGKRMFIYLQKGRLPKPAEGSHVGGVSKSLFDVAVGSMLEFMPCLCLRAADGTIVCGWLASQTDMLAEDWSIFEEEQES